LFFPKVAWVGANRLLARQSCVEFQRNEALTRGRQKQRSNRRFHVQAMKKFHVALSSAQQLTIADDSLVAADFCRELQWRGSVVSDQ
jgi:hypothetical protein